MRLKFVFVFIFLFFSMLLVRIYYLSIKSNEYFESLAQDNAIKTELVSPVRGQILDSKNRPLAINKLGFSIFLAPHLKQNLDSQIEILTQNFTDLNTTAIKKEYQKQDSPYNQDFIEVVSFLDYDLTISKLALLNLNENIKVTPTSQRFYPYEDLASHVIGYVGKSNAKDVENNLLAKLIGYVGKSGVESFYNELLQGEAGERKTKVTALNKVVEEISYKEPISNNIALTIDLEFQKFLSEIFKDKAGAVIVVDLKTGGILGAGSFPEYNLNPFVTGISKDEWDKIINDLNHPFTNKLVNGLYPPGSVLKMAVGMSFLNSGKITPETKFYCSGAIELGGRKFRCWKASGHGNLNFVDALRDSCDVYFYEGSLIVGIDYIASYLEKLGFGVKTGVDLPNEFVGTIPNKAWKMQKYKKQWFLGETVNASIGQGYVLITPMQMAKHTAQIATGKAIVPHFIKSINEVEQNFEYGEFLTPQEKPNLALAREGMYKVANDPGGTAYGILQGIPFAIAAKTGTAQVVGISQSEIKRMREADMEYFKRSHSWMTTFGPYNDPQFAVTVLVEHGGGGGSAGGPLIKAIYSKLVEMGYIKIPEPVEISKKTKKK